MIDLVPIRDRQNPHFAECWGLYESAFPSAERREEWYHHQTMENSCFHFDALVDGEELIGLVGWWGFDSIIYIEHLATFAHLRNRGYGRAILSKFKAMEPTKSLLLEVEHPIDDLTHRRIAFYERAGFVLNHHHYAHPPYRGSEMVELLVMTYPNPITREDLDLFKSSYFPQIHFR